MSRSSPTHTNQDAWLEELARKGVPESLSIFLYFIAAKFSRIFYPLYCHSTRQMLVPKYVTLTLSAALPQGSSRSLSLPNAATWNHQRRSTYQDMASVI